MDFRKRIALATTIAITGTSLIFAPLAHCANFSFGTPLEFDGGVVVYLSIDTMDSDSFVICRTESDTQDVRCASFTYNSSTNTPTEKTDRTAEADAYTASVFKTGSDCAIADSDTIVTVYPEDTGSDDGHISATNEVSNDLESFTDEAEFDSNGDAEMSRVANIGSNKVAIIYNGENASNEGYITIVTLSGDNLTVGTPTEIDSSSTDGEARYGDVVGIDDDKLVVAQEKNADGSEKISVCTVSTRTPTCTAWQAVRAATMGWKALCSPWEEGGTADRFVLMGGTIAIAGTVSTTTVSLGSETSTALSEGGCAFVSEDDFVAVGRDGTDSHQVKMVLGTVDWSDRSITLQGSAEEAETVNNIAVATVSAGASLLNGFGTSPEVAFIYIDDADNDSAHVVMADVTLPSEEEADRRIMMVN